MKKSLIFVLLLCLITSGCGSKNQDNIDSNLEQPIIEGEHEVSISNLKFFIPKELTVNSYNGINNTFNYYIEKSGDNCEVYLTLTNASKYNSSISKYMKEYIKASKYDERTINNAKWYQVNSGNNYSYSTIIGEYFYNVSTKISQNGSSCSKLNDMIKNTLFVVTK